MRVNYNVSAMIAQNALSVNDKKYTASTGRLSSGKKINNAKDNPSGLAMSRRMNAQIKGLQEAKKNSGNSINAIKTADGALSEIHDMLQRMNELAVQASTDTLQDVDRDYIQNEIAQLKEEIGRIRNNTQFNGQNLLDGTFGKKVYSALGLNGLQHGDTTDPYIKVLDVRGIDKFEDFCIVGMSTKLRNSGDIQRLTRDNSIKDDNHELDPEHDLGSLTATYFEPGTHASKGNVFNGEIKTEIYGDCVRLYDLEGRSLTLQIDREITASEYVHVNIPDNGDYYAKDRYGMASQTGSNEGQMLNVEIPDISLNYLGIRFTDVSDPSWAREAISDIKRAINSVSEIRSNLGAYQNRLEHTVTSLEVNEENMTSSYSTIMDTDMAEEMTEYSTLQVMTQAGISMLAQANQRPADLLQLLQ
ncbi:MAG: flagellin [Lachnospiraceae bacterium]|nr:flagellin [Lachnospiraceae bacterium]